MTLSRRKRLWLYSVLSFLFVTNITTLWKPLLDPEKGLSLLGFTTLGISGVAYALLFYWYIRPPKREFIQKLSEDWNLFLRKSESVGFELMFVRDAKSGRFRWVPTEFAFDVIEKGSILVLFPACDEERDAVLARVTRGYLSQLSEDSVHWIGSNRRVPLRIQARVDESIQESIEHQIGAMIGEDDDSVAVEGIIKWLKGDEYRILPIIQALEFTPQQFKGWIDNCAAEIAAFGAVVTASASDESLWVEVMSQRKEIAIAHVTRKGAGPHWISRIEHEIHDWSANLAEKLSIKRTTSQDRLRKLALGFLNLEFENENRMWFNSRDLRTYDEKFDEIAEHIPAWVECRERGGNLFAWKIAAARTRDYLVAVSILQNELDLSDAFLKKVNDDPRCTYVRSILDVLSEGSCHLLSGFELHSHHSVILCAWQLRSIDNEALLQALRDAKGSASPPLLESDDLETLLPRIVQAGASKEFSDLLRPVPFQKRISAIFSSGAASVQLAGALQWLATPQELWEYFDSGQLLPLPAMHELAKVPDIEVTTQLVTMMLLAPHGQQLPDIFLPIVQHAFDVGSPQWRHLNMLPISESDLELVATRIVDAANRTGEDALMWLQETEPFGHDSPRVAALLVRIKQAIRPKNYS